MWERHSCQYARKGVLLMRRINIQKGVLILLYITIILGFFWFSMNEVHNMNNVISVDDYIQEVEVIPENAEKDAVNKVMDGDDYNLLYNYQDYYQNQFNQQLIFIVIKFSIVFLVASIIFWLLMHKLQKNEKLLIAADLKSLKQYQALPEADPILKQAYQTIQASYESHFEDFKRLHSYLSHEQKNELALLQNNLELHEYERCANNIRSLHQGIEDLLTISDSAQDSALYPVDAVEVCAKVCDDYRCKANINFIFDEDECLIKAKERWIHRAVANLVDNAIKYGEGKPIEVLVHQDNDEILISVKDEGIGIDKKQQELIFQHHVRINELKKDGYGIGLSLVRHVVDLSQGKISLISEKGKGSTITLHFPIYKN